jgi:hypothetical protein
MVRSLVPPKTLEDRTGPDRRNASRPVRPRDPALRHVRSSWHPNGDLKLVLLIFRRRLWLSSLGVRAVPYGGKSRPSSSHAHRVLEDIEWRRRRI